MPLNHDAATPAPTTRLIVARHGEVAERWRGTVYGRLDVELSPRGLEQSRRIGAALRDLPIDAVVSSGLQRAEAAADDVARQRREALSVHGRSEGPSEVPERASDSRFLELDRGDWAGVTLADLAVRDPQGHRAWLDARGALRAPNGESPDDVALRTVPAFADWASRFPGGVVVVIAHLWVVRSAVAHCLGLPMARSGELLLPPGGVCEFDWPAGGDGRAPVMRRFGSDAVESTPAGAAEF